MKVGIDSYCYHRFFGEVYPMQKPSARPCTMDSFLDRAKELGCDGVSLESCFFPEFGEKHLSGLRRRLDELGFDRVYAWGHPDGLEAGGNEKPISPDFRDGLKCIRVLDAGLKSAASGQRQTL